MIPHISLGIQIIQDANLLEEGIVSIPLLSRTNKHRGVTLHKRGMVPSTNFYEIKPNVWVCHPAMYLALKESLEESPQEANKRIIKELGYD